MLSYFFISSFRVFLPLRRKSPLTPVLFSCYLLLGSCVDYQETLRFLPDGRMELEVYATVVRAMLPMISRNPDWKGFLLLPATLEEARKAYAMGVKVKRWIIEEGAGVVVYDLAITIETPPALSQAIQEIHSGQKIQVVLDEQGKIRYRREIPPLTSEFLPPSFGSMLRERFENSRLVFRIESPSGIIRTNGIAPGPTEAYWETTLLNLRTRGLLMMAEIRVPSLFHRFLWLKPLLLSSGAILFLYSLFLLRRRRRKAYQKPQAPLVREGEGSSSGYP